MLRAPSDAAVVSPAARVSGRIRVPGDKSISHRYALLGALADGRTRISNYSPGADCAATLACLRALGVDIRKDGHAVDIQGRGVRGLAPSASPLDAANSGTTMRLLAGVVAAHPFTTTVGGDASLSRRPMRRVIEPLTRMGARVQAMDGKPPLTIYGTELNGIQYRPDVPSAQVKSALLLAGLQARGQTSVAEPVPTRDHTERALAAFGARVDVKNDIIEVAGGQRLRACAVEVPGDISGAAFWSALAAGTPDGTIEVAQVGLNPSRTALLDIFRRAGADVVATVDDEVNGEPVGTVRVSASSLRSFEIDPSEVPGVIDEIPAFAALGALLPAGETMAVRGASELRVKESDRIARLAQGLRALGASVEEYPDGFRIVAQKLSGGIADSAGDHRLAMAFAIAATGASGPTTISGASAVDVSYPGFFDELRRLTRHGDDR
ncbi:MAG: 3-phosphoshikimate 1-carboxyvinyltransferase [Acidobacteria bacterium]|nr:3-phosphoshikimate 1-carboxyvinyltransferase [Acidobacteriota bacterium]